MKANAPLWIVSLGQGGGDAAAVGGPGAPDITQQGGTVIKFTAGEEGAAGPTLGYGASIEPEGPTLTIDAPDPTVGGEIIIRDTEPNTPYVVTIYGVNVAGRGKSAQTEPFEVNYNSATGGSLSYVDNWLGQEGKWALHTFTGDGNFVVGDNPNNFQIMWISAGGQGGSGFIGEIGYGGKAGGGGGAWERAQKLDEGATYPVKVGKGKQAATDAYMDTVAFGVTCTGGMKGCHTGCPGNGFACDPNGVVNNRPGSEGGTSTGGTGGGCTNNGSSPYVAIANKYGINTSNYGKGGNGTGQDSGGAPGAAGKNGLVIVGYWVGATGTRQTEAAVASEQVRLQALADGYEAGLMDGWQQGMEDQTNPEIDEAIEAAAVADEAKPKRTRKKKAD